MNTSTARLYSLGFTSVRTYLIAALFVIGNILFPQLCHMVPKGGLIMVPIYFFTLVGAYKYGMKTGLLIAVLSPILNYVLVGMPPISILPILLIKSCLLAVAAAIAAQKTGKVSLLAILLAVLAYQVLGSVAEYIITANGTLAVQDFVIGYPGLIFQVIGGYLLLRVLAKI